MLQTLKQPGRDRRSRGGTASPLDVTTRSPALPARRKDDLAAAVGARPEPDDGLIAAAGPIILAAYVLVLAVAVLTFKGNGEALLAVAVSITFAIVFFGVPMAMMRIRASHDARWQKAASGRYTGTVDTYTGRVARTEAVLHMVIVPIVVGVAFACFAAIWVLVRP